MTNNRLRKCNGIISTIGMMSQRQLNVVNCITHSIIGDTFTTTISSLIYIFLNLIYLFINITNQQSVFIISKGDIKG